MPTPTRSARGWLLNEATGERLEFQFNPVVQDDKGTEYEKHRVPGLSHPVLQFVAGDSRTLSFTLELVADEGRDLLADVRWIQSLQYPTWREGQLREAPPLVVLVLGRSLSVRGVVRKVSVTYKRWAPDFSQLLEATVRMDMEEYAPESVSMEDVLRGRSQVRG